MNAVCNGMGYAWVNKSAFKPDEANNKHVKLPCMQRINLRYADSLFVCFVALCPKSTAMVMAGRSVHLTTLFPGQA